ncbi:VOC family protein [Nitrospirillum sp. BR 11164]|uniref:VOC family protein n=1 Tax=Nitrospirillum sp. BR 11164 TaxID=3104324 RepID=UPI002B003958|nr:VOC family protein [Nitrospirillum sp. BR 11164]MEA1650256.1 VOC family protein [Nitrospirillum sp. BR 11164]
MANHLRFFAIHAEDVERAKTFYEAVFDWRITPWGPPGFYLIQTGAEGERHVGGALQQRHEPVSGTGMKGFECTVGVDDLDAIMAKVTAHGGTIVMQPYTIDGVGRLIYLHDTEGNRVGAMQYDPAYAAAFF